MFVHVVVRLEQTRHEELVAWKNGTYIIGTVGRRNVLLIDDEHGVGPHQGLVADHWRSHYRLVFGGGQVCSGEVMIGTRLRWSVPKQKF